MSRRDPPPGRILETMIAELESAGLHRAEIARRSGLNKSTIGRFGNGMSQQPSHEKFQRVADLHARVLPPRR